MDDIEKHKIYFKEHFPKGNEFFKWVFSNDKINEELTHDIYLNDKEFNSYETFESIPELLEIIYKVSTCYFGCHDGPHIVEYITGRGYNLAISAIKLLRLGFYDESLSLIRSLSEINNLFALFAIEPETLKEWYEMSEKDRIRNFGPGKVREKLTKTELGPPISKEYYSILCEVGVHVNPDTKPQGKNHIDRALVGGFVSKEYSIAVLNDLVFNLVWFAIFSLRNSVNQQTFEEQIDKVQGYFEKIGKLNIESIDEYLKKSKCIS